MTLIDAPPYDPRRDNLKRNILIGVGVFIVLAIALGMGGFVLGHGWFFSNLPAEHQVNRFLDALQAKNYPAAYSIYTNGHPDTGYPLQRFTEDWTTMSPVKAPIVSHHIEISKTDGSGTFGTGIIVATHLNQASTCVFIYVNRADHTLTWPAPHEIVYDKCNNLQ
ncbi:MAG TPA: hypothetical protein VIJ79_13080 [Acidobacteriaceae bacterium]